MNDVEQIKKLDEIINLLDPQNIKMVGIESKLVILENKILKLDNDFQHYKAIN